MPIVPVVLAVLSKLPWKAIGIALAAIALSLLLWRAPWAENRGKAIEVAKYQPVMTKALARINQGIGALADTKASLDGAHAQINDNNTRIQLAANRLEADKAIAAIRSAALAEKATATDALIAALSAPNSNRTPCTLSPAAKKAIGGL